MYKLKYLFIEKKNERILGFSFHSILSDHLLFSGMLFLPLKCTLRQQQKVTYEVAFYFIYSLRTVCSSVSSLLTKGNLKNGAKYHSLCFVEESHWAVCLTKMGQKDIASMQAKESEIDTFSFSHRTVSG